MAKTLDRSKSFGTVTGDDLGRAYEQDGAFFVATGELWQPAPEPEILPSEADKPAGGSAKRKPAPAPEAVDPQLAAQLGQV